MKWKQCIVIINLVIVVCMIIWATNNLCSNNKLGNNCFHYQPIEYKGTWLCLCITKSNATRRTGVGTSIYDPIYAAT